MNTDNCANASKASVTRDDHADITAEAFALGLPIKALHVFPSVYGPEVGALNCFLTTTLEAFAERYKGHSVLRDDKGWEIEYRITEGRINVQASENGTRTGNGRVTVTL